MGLYLQKRCDICSFFKVSPAVEILVNQFDDEIHVYVLRVELLHQVVCRTHRAAGGEEVVVKQHHVVFGYSVLVYLYGVLAIFLAVALLDSLGRELSRFATQHHTGVQFQGESL